MGLTALYRAVVNSSLDTATLLLKWKAAMDHVDNAGRSPLPCLVTTTSTPTTIAIATAIAIAIAIAIVFGA